MANHISFILLFSNFDINLPNATKYTNKIDKKIPQNKTGQVFCGESTGLQRGKWIANDFWTGCPEIKAAILVKF